MRVNNFNKVAPFYDLLARLVFGNSLEEAQIHFLNDLPEDNSVLFVGGGTGQLLKHPFFHKASNVDYLELSEKMIDHAKSHSSHLKNINFIQGNFFDHEGKYDIIICNFFLDCFNQANLNRAVERLLYFSDQDTMLIVTDFKHTNHFKHRILIRSMISFFRLFSKLESRKLHNIQSALNKWFAVQSRVEFEDGLIFSSVYRIVTSQAVSK